MSLSPAAENRLLLLGLGLTTYAAFTLMRRLLVVYRDSVEAKKPKPKAQYITQGTEDSLRPSTLEKLIDSHNHSIQETACRIVCDRALHDEGTIDELLYLATRPDHETREKALRAIYMLTGQPGTSNLNTAKLYTAIVKSLTRSVTDVPHEVFDKGYSHFDFRDAAERLCLLILSRMVNNYGPYGIVKAGFVPKWLALEPWGGTEREIQETFELLMGTHTVLAELVMQIAHTVEGLNQLVQAKLIPPTKFWSYSGEGPFSRTNLQETAEARRLSEIALAEGVPRAREQSAEERHLRRRHREAMVLNDGVQPIGVSDIIERDYESPTDERRR